MNFEKLRSDFPIIAQKMDGNPLIYFDSASTSQKPQVVIDALVSFYARANANVHRGIYQLAEDATTLFEDARKKIATFINALPEEIVFTRGTTDSINMVAGSWGLEHIQDGDEIIVTELEHHSNFVPWQQLAIKQGAILRIIAVNQDGTLQMDQLERYLNKKTKLIAISQVSNALGVHNDIPTFVRAARSVGAKILVDAAQSAAHQAIDVKKLDVDFLAFSVHKLLGPTGIGILYIKKSLHEQMPPFEFGGGMIYEVCLHKTSFLRAPYKFEAGTPPIAQAIGLAAAVDYMKKNINFDALQKYEASLCAQLIEGVSPIQRIQLLGPLEQLSQKGHLVSFIVDGMHSHDVAAYLSKCGICVRAGHHCAQPLAKKLGLDATVRASFYFYNTPQEVEHLIFSLKKLVAE